MKKEQIAFLEATVRNGNPAAPFVMALRAALDVYAKKRGAEFRAEDFDAIMAVLVAETHDDERNDALKALIGELGTPSSPITPSSEPLARAQIDGLLAALSERDEKHTADVEKLAEQHAAELDARDAKHAEEIAKVSEQNAALAAKFDALMAQLGGGEKKAG